MPKNYYEIFGVQQDSTQEEIKKAYRKLAHRYHPDKKHTGSDEKMKEINYIYSILSDFQQRKNYNETLDYSFKFEEEDFDYGQSDSWVDIYCDDLIVIDSAGRKTKIRTGDSIYYEVEIDKSVITWKYKSKEYFSVYIKKIFNPEKKQYFSEAVKYNLEKEPLFIVYFAGQDVIIYRDEFESYWLSKESYKKIDRRRGLITAGIIAFIFIYGFLYLFNTYKPSTEQQDKFRESSEKEQDNEYRDYLKKEYFATDREINYIATGKYQLCTKKITNINGLVEVTNAPTSLSLSAGEIKKDTEANILLYDDSSGAYKIQAAEIKGWIPEKFLNNPTCEEFNLE